MYKIWVHTKSHLFSYPLLRDQRFERLLNIHVIWNHHTEAKLPSSQRGKALLIRHLLSHQLLDFCSSQNLGGRPKCLPFTVLKHPRFIDLWIACLITSAHKPLNCRNSRRLKALSLMRHATAPWWEQMVSQSCLYFKQWFLATAWNHTPLSPSSHLCHCLLLYDPLSPIFSNKHISFAQGENPYCPFPIISCFLSKIRLATCTEHWTSFQYFPGGQIYIHHSAEMTRFHLDISYKTKDHVQRTTLSWCSIKQYINRKLTFRSDSGRLRCTLFSYGIPE